MRKEVDSVRSKLIQQVHNYIQINNMYVGVSVRVWVWVWVDVCVRTIDVCVCAYAEKKE